MSQFHFEKLIMNKLKFYIDAVLKLIYLFTDKKTRSKISSSSLKSID